MKFNKKNLVKNWSFRAQKYVLRKLPARSKSLFIRPFIRPSEKRLKLSEREKVLVYQMCEAYRLSFKHLSPLSSGVVIRVCCVTSNLFIPSCEFSKTNPVKNFSWESKG